MPIVTLNKLADLVPASDKRRKALENIDRIAQGAIDATRTYMNKAGDEITVETPDWGNALKAQIAGAALLGLTGDMSIETTGIEKPLDRILRAVPGKGGA